MNDEEQAFFRAMETAGEDDMPRLVYADWLDDHSQVERAKIIRLQEFAWRGRHTKTAAVEAAEQEAHDLVSRNWQNWLRDFPKWVTKRDFFRGFPDVRCMTARQFLNHADQFRTRMPVDTVYFSKAGGLAATVFAAEAFSALRTVGLDECQLDDLDVLALAESRNACQIRDLKLDRTAGFLSSDENRLTDESIEALIQSTNLPALERLSLAGYRTISVGAIQKLLEANTLSGLRGLNVGVAIRGPELGKAFATDGFCLINLRELLLRQCYIGDDGVTTLAESSHLSGLTELDLSHNLLTDRAVEVILNSDSLRKLRRLDLKSNWQITPAAIERLTLDRDWEKLAVDE